MDQICKKDGVIIPRELILRAEKMMIESDDADKVEIKVKHYMCSGMYAREIFIPKGTLLSGEIHKKEHINVISKGKIEIVTEKGKVIIEAPFTMIAGRGVKRLGYALEDTIWITFHATDKKDIKEIRKEVIAESYEEYLEYERKVIS